MSPPPTAEPAVVRFYADPRHGPTLADLKALTLGHLEGGTAELVLDLRAAGHLGPRALGTLVYVLALFREAGEHLYLRVAPAQKGTLFPYASLFSYADDGEGSHSPSAHSTPLP
jgi:hypothetical protein